MIGHHITAVLDGCFQEWFYSSTLEILHLLALHQEHSSAPGSPFSFSANTLCFGLAQLFLFI